MVSKTDHSGKNLGNRYELVRLLGKGGMGTVYLGRHTVIGKQVAIKFLNADLADNEEIVKRFYREAQAAAAIGHKNIIDVIDVGISPDGEPYLVMEYLEGESLSGMLTRTGPIDLPAACGILEPMLKSLQAAHDKGIVHRDLKPENIFLAHHEDEPPIVKLIDFGISKFTGSTNQTGLTRTGTMLGTPNYMSPEQARGVSDLDGRSDIYSVGVILYEMLSGELPFAGENYNELLMKILTEEPTPPQTAYPGFPEAAVPLVMKTLSKDPDERPSSPDEMLQEIKQLESFGEREKRLTHFAESIQSNSVAGGDLGASVSEGSSGEIASEVLSDMAGRSTPEAWEDSDSLIISKRKLTIGVAIGVVLVVCAGLGIYSFLSGDKSVTEPIPILVETPQEPKEGVQEETESLVAEIELVGLPEGAKVYFKEAPVSLNPFKVDKSETIAPLKVEASGYKPFTTTVVPSKDLQIVVHMVPEEEPEKQDNKPTKSGGKRPKPNKPPNNTDDGFKSGNRGTKYSDEFE